MLTVEMLEQEVAQIMVLLVAGGGRPERELGLAEMVALVELALLVLEVAVEDIQLLGIGRRSELGRRSEVERLLVEVAIPVEIKNQTALLNRIVQK